MDFACEPFVRPHLPCSGCCSPTPARLGVIDIDVDGGSLGKGRMSCGFWGITGVSKTRMCGERGTWLTTVAWALYKTYGRMSGSIGVAGVSRVEVAGEALESDADLPRGRH